MSKNLYPLSYQQHLFVKKDKNTINNYSILSAEISMQKIEFIERLEKATQKHEAFNIQFVIDDSGIVLQKIVNNKCHINEEHETSIEKVYSSLLKNEMGVEAYQGPNCYIFSNGNGPFTILFSVPAIVADLPSLKIILQEVIEGSDSNNDVMQYLDYAQWESELEPVTFWKNISIPDADTTVTDSQQIQFSVDSTYTKEMLFKAWCILLARLNNESDFYVGYHTDCRDLDELHNAVGPYAKALPIKVKTDLTFDVVIQKAMEYQHEYRANDRSSYQFSYVDLSLLKLKSLFFHHAITPAPLHLACIQTDTTLVVQLNYASHILSKTDVKFFQERLVHILRQLEKNTVQNLDEYGVVGINEKKLIEHYTFNTGTPTAPVATLLEQIEAMILSQPDHIAIIEKYKSVTYQDLWKRAAEISDELKNHGVDVQSCVAVQLSRCMDLLASILAIIKIGAIYVPIDKDSPEKRTEFIINNSRAVCLIKERECGLCYIRCSQSEALKPISDEKLIYIIHTSGSTGTPKGVMVTEKNLLNYANWLVSYSNIQKNDIVEFGVSPSFDASITTSIVPLLQGASILIIDEETKLNPLEYLQTIDKNNVTISKATPTYLEECLPYLSDVSLNHLRMIIVGGEALLSVHVKAWLAIHPNHIIFNQYGPTEATVGTIGYSIQQENVDELQDPIPIGTPAANTDIHILNTKRQLCPIGVSGEIYIAGDSIAQGYLNLPERTEESFFQYQNKRIYKTGDRGYLNCQGEIVYIGRNDNQVKHHGYRIELGEIESILVQHESIQQAVVILREVEGEKKLIAFIKAAKDTDVSLLREFCFERIPHYMLPQYFISLDSFPTTTTGKVDRLKLSDGSSYPVESKAKYQAPENDLEKLCVELWETLLKKEKIGVHDDFFALGGDSITAAIFTNKLQEKYQTHIDVILIFDKSTIRKFTTYLEDTILSNTTQSILVPDTDESSITINHLLSPIQYRAWWIDTRFNQTTAYHTRIVIKIHKQIDKQKLENAFNKLVDNNQILRTVFKEINDVVEQVILHARDFKLSTIDITINDEVDFVQAVKNEAEKEFLKAFDIAEGPLLRAILFQNTSGCSALVMHLHQIISDDYSKRLLLDELFSYYHGEDLPRASCQYQDFITWQNKSILSDRLLRQFWREYLHDAPFYSTIRFNNTISDTVTFKGQSFIKPLSGNLVTQLQQYSQKHNMTVFMTLLGFFKITLSQIMGQKDIVIGTTVSNRGRAPHQQAIGRYANRLPIRSNLILATTVQEALNTIKQSMLKSLSHQDLPLFSIMEAVGVEPSESMHPLYQISFSHDTSPDIIELDNISVEKIAVSVPLSKYDISIVLHEHDGQVKLLIEYNTQLYSQLQIDQLLEDYISIIEQGLSDFTGSIDKLVIKQRVIGLEKNGFSIPKANREEMIPASFAQRRLYFLYRMEPKSYVYNSPNTISLSGKVDSVMLERSLNKMVSRYEILRTNFVAELDDVYQVIHQNRTLVLEVIDARNDAINIDSLLLTDFQKPFNLESDMLIRARLYQVADAEYKLMICFHHNVIDGWSKSIFYNELWDIYHHLNTEPEYTLPMLDIQFADYAHWQRCYAKSDAYKKDLRFWKEYLVDSPTTTMLPVDFTRASMSSPHGDYVYHTLSSKLSRELKIFIKKNGLSAFNFFFAVFNLLVSRYAQQSDLIIGIPLAGRNHPQLQEQVGFFIHTLPIRNKIDESVSTEEFLTQIADTFKQAFQHQETPFEHIVEAVNPERNTSFSPLFQLCFAYQNFPHTTTKLPGLIVDDQTANAKVAHFDITLDIYENEDLFDVRVEYATSLFHENTIHTLIECYENLLEGMASHPKDLPIDSLDLLSNTMRNEICALGKGTCALFNSMSTVSNRIEEIAVAQPDSIALLHGVEKLTYSELNVSANQLAHYLAKKKIGQGDFIGVCIDHSFHMIISMLAVLKLGAAYVPIDSRHPYSRIAYIVKDASLKCMLSDTKNCDLFASVNIDCVILDQINLTNYNHTNLNINLNSSALAYVIYTSGTTGQPKGVMVSHGNLFNYFSWLNSELDLSTLDIFECSTALSFDTTVDTTLFPLTSGYQVLLINNELKENPRLYLEVLMDNKVTVMGTSPSAFSLLTPQDNSLRYVLIGAEPIIASDVVKWIDTNSKLTFFNTYGPTEVTVACVGYLIDKNNYKNYDRNTYPIGKVSCNNQGFILDKNKQCCPIGVIGELHIAGASVSQGYLNQPKLTHEKFTSTPWGPSKIMYATGDLVKYNTDGVLEYCGRSDNQIKLRGYRIEVGEIESALLSHPDISQAVIVIKKINQDKKLLAYLVMAEGATLDKTRLKSFLSTQLPIYMLPNYYLPLDKLPMTVNGKLDSRALPLPDTANLQNTRYLAPESKSEKLLIHICQELLAIDKVSLSDNFFDIGGHSLLSLQVIARMEEEGCKVISPREFVFNNLKQLARLYDDSEGDNIHVENTTVETPIPYFFGENNHLFGCYHPAVDDEKQEIAVLLCYPFGQEYIRAHRAYRILAKELVAVGIPVMRFDFHGNGDSHGDFSNLCLEKAICDISESVAELKKQSDISNVCVISARLAANVVCAYARQHDNISSAILWDRIYEPNISNHTGFIYPESFISQFKSLPLSESRDSLSINHLMLDSDVDIWTSEPNQSLVPYKTIHEMVAWVMESNNGSPLNG